MRIAGLSGVLRRMLPSAYHSPSRQTAGKNTGIAADAITCSMASRARTPMRVTRLHGMIEAAPSKKLTPRPVR